MKAENSLSSPSSLLQPRLLLMINGERKPLLAGGCKHRARGIARLRQRSESAVFTTFARHRPEMSGKPSAWYRTGTIPEFTYAVCYYAAGIIALLEMLRNLTHAEGSAVTALSVFFDVVFLHYSSLAGLLGLLSVFAKAEVHSAGGRRKAAE